MYLPLLPTVAKSSVIAHDETPKPPTPPRIPVMHSTAAPMTRYQPQDLAEKFAAPVYKQIEWLPVVFEDVVVYIRSLTTTPQRRNTLRTV